MKLTILQENLAKAVTQASRFASTHAQLPVLSNILLSTDKTKLNISSTNLEISVSTLVGAKIEEEGEISIPSKTLSDLVSNLPKDTIALESDKEQLKISAPGFSSKVLGMNASDFPKIPNSVNKEKSVTLLKSDLMKILPKSVFAASIDETRPVLTGVLFILEKTNLTLVSTDGFRLSKSKISLKSSVIGKVIIPKGILNELMRTSEESGEILFEIDEKEKRAIFGIGDVTLTSRLLEGDYPDYEKIIPKSSSLTVLSDKEELLRAVKLASIFARDSANIVKLKIEKESIKVLAESGSSGSQETSIDAKTIGEVGKNFEIAFNFRFLEEFLHSAFGEEIKMEFTSTDKAGVFSDSSDKDYIHLIMPVKVQG